MELLSIDGSGQMTKYFDAKKGQTEGVKVLWAAMMSTIVTTQQDIKVWWIKQL